MGVRVLSVRVLPNWPAMLPGGVVLRFTFVCWSIIGACQLGVRVYQPTAILKWLFHSWACLSISLVPVNVKPVIGNSENS